MDIQKLQHIIKLYEISTDLDYNKIERLKNEIDILKEEKIKFIIQVGRLEEQLRIYNKIYS